MKRPVVKYVLETIIPKFREVGESLTYLHGSSDEGRLYYGKSSILHIEKKDKFSSISDIYEVLPEDIVTQEDLLQCLREDLYQVSRICAGYNVLKNHLNRYSVVFSLLPNMRSGVELDNGGKLIFIGPITPGFDEVKRLKLSSKEMGSRITYILDNNVYFKDVIEFAYHYRNNLMRFG